MTAKRMLTLFVLLLLIAALAAGCGSGAHLEAQVDSVQLVHATWSHPEPCDDNTYLFTDDGQIQELVRFFTELNYQKKYETREEMWEANIEVMGNAEYYIDFMSGGESVRHYTIHEIETPMCIQFESDETIYQMADEDSQRWKVFATNLTLHDEFKGLAEFSARPFVRPALLGRHICWSSAPV